MLAVQVARVFQKRRASLRPAPHTLVFGNLLPHQFTVFFPARLFPSACFEGGEGFFIFGGEVRLYALGINALFRVVATGRCVLFSRIFRFCQSFL